MAQLVARLVRNEKVGGSNPPSSTTGRHPIRMSVFCMPGRVGAVPVVALPLVFRAPDGPAAREARHPHFVRCRASKPARALRSLRRPSHQWGRVAVWSLTPGPAAHRHRSQAPLPTGAAAGFSGPPMWSGLSCWDFGALRCVLLQTSSIQGVFRVAFCPVVTNVVNPRAFSLKIVVFGLRLTTFVTEALERRWVKSCGVV